MLTIATVNVNGIRAAFRRGMGDWLEARRPDVLALQEVRAGDDHLAAHLGPAWHVAHAECDSPGRAGVAVASRLPVRAVRVGLGAPRPEFSGRWVEVDVVTPGGADLTVASVYVHKGEAGTPRMAEKYAFLDAVTVRLRDLAASGRGAVVGGDLNIAHRELDLKNWRGNRDHAGFLPAERAYLDRWFGAPEGSDTVGSDLGRSEAGPGAPVPDGAEWVDVARHLAGDVPGPYTWWSWRGKAFDNDAGWRIDYQLATTALADRAKDAWVDRAPSYAERFSDHAPLVVAYDV